ncbi:T9SS type A sorting domain-containing protein [Flavobacterium sp. SUN046]|uniref:T9SS type A sorting domain-containing protein n=1 Tax=Flavobacterium sp. SUN046 TaxID=3002440 RepID=UPI002DBD6959|nr:T9SS type A sorting domain-containing protein [Flavobacterium sp. SUN046]MEC4048266.1 T9SS type A sorting domain-containing protein [Flavobacterium sp. SUN046]
MKKVVLIAVCLFSLSMFPHTLNYHNQVLRHWIFTNHTSIDGTYSMYKNGKVYIEDAHNQIIGIPLSNLSKEDQGFALKKADQINTLNHANILKKSTSVLGYQIGILLIILFSGMFFIYKRIDKQKHKYLIPIIGIGILSSLYSFAKKKTTTTDPLFINAAFTPFVPNVNTSWDNTYFYVESKGIPNHTMMVGISNHGWQQQVPIPQCYIGANHWSIPLNPVIAATPTAIDNVHFTRGAIAIAANGVPIFNYHTNTGVDSYLDGQLDNYGGHCGRGDDYHYHIAPTHLYTLGQTTTNLPCAFSLDGFAVYGSVEPDGSAMTTLDANHGHYGTNGVYHYHGTATAPYMIANFVGQVTEDTTNQLVPQAAAHPVRNENWTPLSGAVITSCVANANNNGFNLSYSLNGTPGYATNFSWSGTTYSFNYVTPSGTTTTNYNGFTQCSVPLSNAIFATDQSIKLYPNPSKGLLYIDLGNSNLINEVQNISIFSAKGELVYKTNGFQSNITIQNLATGTYFVKIQFVNTTLTKKLLVE